MTICVMTCLPHLTVLLSTDILVWVPPEAGPETRILVQVVYWEVNPGSTSSNGEVREKQVN